MTLATLSVLGFTAAILVLKIGLIVAAVVWAFREWFRPASPPAPPAGAEPLPQRVR